MSTNFIKGNFAVVPNLEQALILEGSELNIYLALCKYANADGGCWPSYSTLAETTGRTTNTCKRAIEALVIKGFLAKSKRKRPNGSHASNHYQLLIMGGVVSSADHPSIVGDTPRTIPIEHTIVSDDGYGSDSSNSSDLVDEAHDAPPVVETTTRKLYYDVVKMYQLVVNNHNHMTKWAKDLEASLGYDLAVLYLTRLLERDLRKERETEEFVPTLTKPMDICVKAPKIIEYFKRTKKAVLTDRRSYE